VACGHLGRLNGPGFLGSFLHESLEGQHPTAGKGLCSLSIQKGKRSKRAPFEDKKDWIASDLTFHELCFSGSVSLCFTFLQAKRWLPLQT
jgi:hypothetical protein